MSDSTRTPVQPPARDDAYDPELASALKNAYDQIELAPDAQERMLAALKAASADAKRAETPEPPRDADQPSVGAPIAPRKRRFSVVKVVVPVAACLLVGAIAVGVGGVLTTPTSAPVASDRPLTANTPTPSGTESTNNSAPANAMTQESAIGGAYEGFTTMDVESDLVVPVPGNTEEYAAVDENGFVATKTTPLSTVSADVDTASYCNLRRMITSGYALSDIPSGAVRIEEMLNYFDYSYVTPHGNDLFSMNAEVAPCPWNDDTQLLVLGFATTPTSAVASNGANLVFLIDVSGSMNSPDKLGLLQDSFATLLEGLDANDRVSIVTYASGEEVVLDGASGDDEAAILRAIYKLRASGSTNGQAGLQKAYELAKRNFIAGGVNRIVMASDGDLNVGITSESELHDFVESKRETGVYLSVLGFGSGNYKDTKMETLADHGNGSYHYIDCIEEAQRVLGHDLTANIVPLADDVKIQVEFNPAQVKAYRLIGYENREMAAEEFLDDSADAGEVGPGAQFTVAYEIALADSAYEEPAVPDLKYAPRGETYGTGEASSEWLTCSLRCKDVNDGDAVREQELVVSADDARVSPSDDWRFAAAVVEFGMLAQQSDYLGTASLEDVDTLLARCDLTPEREGFRELVARVK